MSHRVLRAQPLTALMLLGLAAGSALAQEPAPPGSSPGPLPAAPVVNGHDVQPKNEVPGGQTDPEAEELLRQTHDTGPVVPPHDLYGNPLGVDTTNITTDTGGKRAQPGAALPSSPPK